MNYDYATNSTKRCDDPGEPGCQGSDGGPNLPDSLYLASKPAWFGQTSWPPIGPDVNPMDGDIPAKLRFYGQSTAALSGDVNNDGRVDIQDIQACVNHILESQDWREAADVNGNGIVDVADIQEIINSAMGG